MNQRRPKIIQLRSNIMNFRQLDNEHVSQAWERMKYLVKNCPTHGLTTWMVIQTFYAGLNFTSRNLLDSVREEPLCPLHYVLLLNYWMI